MGIFRSLVHKEALHIVRDRRTVTITLLMPLVLLLLFGFAISTEVNSVRVVAVVDRHTHCSRQLLQRMEANEYFDFVGLVSAHEVDGLLRCGRADAALMVSTRGPALSYQIVVDASNPTTARAMTGYLQGVIAGTQGQAADDVVTVRTLYNPRLRSAYNFVPGILGMIFILICAIMTSVSIVREKETGTMNLLLVSPVRPHTIILGKLLPYFLLSCVILAAMLLTAYTVLGLPVSASVGAVVAVSLLYVVLSLSIGLLVSTLVSTQLTALIVSAVVFMIPVIMLSGMMFPIENMPLPLQWVSCVIPARWYIEAMRRLMVQQLGLGGVMHEVIILAVMTVALLLLAIKKFKSSRP